MIDVVTEMTGIKKYFIMRPPRNGLGVGGRDPPVGNRWSKVFERLISVSLGRFMECSGVLPTTQFAYRKGLGTCDAPVPKC